ncbi:MAG: DNA mismatch endonuclease Vsr [Betaproteobacteria bacterium]|nr:DNA mismatch endonuclease Vsr [Betaproteobacteria bacterium]
MCASPTLMTTPRRSALMRRVGRENTAPEMLVRRFLHADGLRFRVNVHGMPGTPDIVLPRWLTVVFVHGCFWHGHGCKHGRIAARSNARFWAEKIDANRRRDAAKSRALRRLGWRVFRIWECQCRNSGALARLSTRIRH